MSHFASVSGAGGSFSVPLPAENQTATMTWAVPWAYINGLADADADAWRPDRGSLARTIHDQGGVLACNGGFAFVLSGGPPPVRWWRGAVQ